MSSDSALPSTQSKGFKIDAHVTEEAKVRILPPFPPPLQVSRSRFFSRSNPLADFFLLLSSSLLRNKPKRFSKFVTPSSLLLCCILPWTSKLELTPRSSLSLYSHSTRKPRRSSLKLQEGAVLMGKEVSSLLLAASFLRRDSTRHVEITSSSVPLPLRLSNAHHLPIPIFACCSSSPHLSASEGSRDGSVGEHGRACRCRGGRPCSLMNLEDVSFLLDDDLYDFSRTYLTAENSRSPSSAPATRFSSVCRTNGSRDASSLFLSKAQAKQEK